MDPADWPELPDDFSVADILRAPLEAREDETAWRAAAAANRAEGEARTALWELDFALQELEWLERGVAREGALVGSIASQLAYATSCLERFPLGLLPLSDELCAELAERFARLSEAIDDLPSGLAEGDALAAAYGRLRDGLERRGVEL